ncbi:phage major tail tube protein [Succinivibrio dextrinosolvens]|uniref:Phage major tail tube protein n=1 Tax=Succinivibrio dextrinosolvens TaxID=83771 RepID=A0A662Z5W3_9GAMM|nr:phage major tail tube protein [Succinivibrio dextrinosolvens]SFJ74243.1 hypothetical protein SAMN04487865_1001116 [Succinivibrio dextrinosolvens]
MAENALTPDKTINYRVYKDGVNQVGIATVDLPELAHMTDTISGAGVAGEIETSVLGHFQAMSATINWRSITEEALTLLNMSGVELTFRGSQQFLDNATNELVPKGVKIITKGITKTVGLGSLEVGASSDTTTEYEITYLKIEIADKEVIELDKLNFIYKVNGTDLLSDVRSQLGM